MLNNDSECIICGLPADPYGTPNPLNPVDEHKAWHAEADERVNAMDAPTPDRQAELWRSRDDVWYTILPNGDYVVLSLDFWHRKNEPRPWPEVAALAALDKLLKQRKINSASVPMWSGKPKLPAPWDTAATTTTPEA